MDSNIEYVRNIGNPEQYLDFCCPECDFKDQSKEKFLQHALEKQHLIIFAAENMELPNLPDEIWAYIFTFLDTFSRHKVASLVSKRWFNIIRTDSKLSGKIEISLKYITKTFNLKSLEKSYADGKLKLLKRQKNDQKASEFPLAESKLENPVLSDPKLHSGITKILNNWPMLKKITLNYDDFCYPEPQKVDTSYPEYYTWTNNIGSRNLPRLDFKRYNRKTSNYSWSDCLLFEYNGNLLRDVRSLNELKEHWNLPFLEEAEIIKPDSPKFINLCSVIFWNQRYLISAIKDVRITSEYLEVSAISLHLYVSGLDHYRSENYSGYDYDNCILQISSDLKLIANYVRNITHVNLWSFGGCLLFEPRFLEAFTVFAMSQNITSLDMDLFNGIFHEDLSNSELVAISNFLSENFSNVKSICCYVNDKIEDLHRINTQYYIAALNCIQNLKSLEDLEFRMMLATGIGKDIKGISL